MPPDYTIRAYARADARALAAVEARASTLFAEFGYPSLARSSPMPVQAFHEIASRPANMTLVAAHLGNGPVGFALVHPLGDFLHLNELAVDPDHGRRGLGAALLHAVIDRSAAQRYTGVSLTTFRDLPFNEQFYTRHRFRPCDLDDAPAELAKQFMKEMPSGITPEKRLLMLRSNNAQVGFMQSEPA